MFKKLFRGLIFFVKLAIEIDPSYIIFLFISQLINAALPLSAVVFPKLIIDELMTGRDITRLCVYAGALVLIQAGGKALDSFISTKYFLARLRIADEYMLRMHANMADADYERMESKDYHDLRERAQKFLYCDWHGFGYVVDQAFAIIGQALTLAGMSAILGRMSWWILAAYAMLVGVDSYIAARAKRKAIALNMEQVEVERRWSYYGSLFEEHRYGKELRAFGIKNWLLSKEHEQGEASNAFYARARQYWQKADMLCALTGTVRRCAGYGYVIANVLSGAFGIGDFTMYTAAMASFSSSMSGLMSSIVDIKQYGLYYDSMEEFLNVPKALREGGNAHIPEGAPELRFEHVSFTYTGQTEPALKDISIAIKPGMKLSIVGENGAGKSTFIKLMMRIYAPTSGRITINGVDISTIDYDEYMTLFAPVFQDFNLYAFSLRENVAFDRGGDISGLIERVGLSHRVDTLPDGVNTPLMKTLDKNGFEPSGGEGQKVALMRALFKSANGLCGARVVVLDEPTAALDPRAEYELYRQFDSLVENRTAVYISHRMSSARFCDEICVFDKGEIAEHGTHDELMQRAGIYAELFEMQKHYYVESSAESAS